MRPRDETAAFHARVDRSGGPDSCWPWLGSRFTTGYGEVWFGHRNRLAHRVAYELANGPIPSSSQAVCHTCDNPLCCNPAHLWLGTVVENIADMDRKGRRTVLRGLWHWSKSKPERYARGDRNGSRQHPERVPKGEAHGQAKLTDRQALEILRRRRAGEGGGALAREFGVSTDTVRLLYQRKSWRHLDAQS
jgi:HNH endonuclease